MFDEVTVTAWEAWTEPPKDTEQAMALWRDYWVAVNSLTALKPFMSGRGEMKLTEDKALVKRIAYRISQQDGWECDEAPDFADWHWEEREELAVEILRLIGAALDSSKETK